MLFHANLGGSPTLLTTRTASREWLHEKDANRLDTDQVERPNTRRVFQRWVQVEVKAILVEQSLLVQGRLPDWLHNKKGLYALDTFDDSMCLFRCIAVHRGVRPNRCTEKAVELAKQFVGANDQQVQLLHTVEFTELKKGEEKFKLGIRVYEPTEDGLWRRRYPPAGRSCERSPRRARLPPPADSRRTIRAPGGSTRCCRSTPTDNGPLRGCWRSPTDGDSPRYRWLTTTDNDGLSRCLAPP